MIRKKDKNMSKNQFFSLNNSLPPVFLDWDLGRELDDVASQYFYQDCEPSTQKLLSHCGWYLSSFFEEPTLVITCNEQVTNWLILKQLMPLATVLYKWLKTAHIRIYPPTGEGTFLDIPITDVPLG
ncbi:hypothetical protein cce_5135 [Crocosphaera subtropica ATCC 51142]|uniref:Uncharacterized protein n=2 Tax=Crocosphaera TaxID=263510 RepID=B1X2X0_CROS5|nr:hypothetical protein cce_5135 [Crocosphaera subtropica ATCC 51142]